MTKEYRNSPYSGPGKKAEKDKNGCFWRTGEGDRSKG